MRKDFYIFRHGETDYNKEQRWQGCGLNAPLNATGVEQAAALAETLRPLGLEIIYSSELKRARQTAEIVAGKLGLDVKILPELKEICLGQAEGLLRAEVSEKFPVVWEKWYCGEDDMHIRFPQGESKQEVQNRMSAAFDELLNTQENIIGIASHSASIRYFLMKFGHKPHKMPNTALFHLIYDCGNWILDEQPV